MDNSTKEELGGDMEYVFASELRLAILRKLAYHDLRRDTLTKILTDTTNYTKFSIRSYIDALIEHGLIDKKRKAGSKYAYLSISERGRGVLQLIDKLMAPLSG